MNSQFSRSDFVICILRFSAIIAASIVCICLKILNVDAVLKYFAFFILFEFVLCICLLQKKMRIPHSSLFVLQSGIFSVLVLRSINRPIMDIYVCLGITCFVLFFLLLVFPLLYRKKLK